MADNSVAATTKFTHEENNGAVTGGLIIIKAPECPRIHINRWRVREGFPVSINQVILLYEILPHEGDVQHVSNKLVHKFKAPCVGVVKRRLFNDGAIVPGGTPLLELTECVHTTVIKDMCADCGADLRQNENGKISEASVPMVHSIPDLKVTQKLAQKLGHDDTRRLLQDRKLVLLVDLDQTIIHTTNDNVPNNIRGIYHFQLYGPQSPWYHTRLRPGTLQFLERMSTHYELHICTFGARNYAHMIAQILDPNGRFFSHRILSRDECFNATSKTDNLKALFPNGDSMVCIIDDREDVWNMASNLIQVKPYHFFQHTGDINAPPGLSKHELDGEGVDFKDIDGGGGGGDGSGGGSGNAKGDGNDAGDSIGSSLGYSGDNGDAAHTGESDCATIFLDNKDVDNESMAKVDIDNAEKTCIKESDLNVLEDSSTPYQLIENEMVDITDVYQSAAEAATCKTTENLQNSNNNLLYNYNSNDNGRMKNNEDKPEIIEKTKVLLEKEIDVDGKEEEVEDKPSNISIIAEQVNSVAAASTSAVTSSTEEEDTLPIMKLSVDPSKQIEIEDPDDYLLYLEAILVSIHKRFYSIYDETKEIPDLKIIVPKIRSEVLRDCNLVFSGLVPTNMKLQQSRAYFIAKSLGANVTQNICEDTTHLVAVTAGTYKVNASKKNPQIKIVNANWLWSCAERWEHVDEKLYPLDRKMKGKQRQPPAHCHSPEHVVNYSEKSEISNASASSCSGSSSTYTRSNQQMEPEKFIDTINPLLSFSNADLADMNKEFDQFFDSDTSSEDDHINIENPPIDKVLRKRKRQDREEERARKFFIRSTITSDTIMSSIKSKDDNREHGKESDKSSTEENTNDEDDADDDGIDDDDDDDEMPSEKFRRGENLPSDLEVGSDSNDDGTDDNNPDEEDDGEWNMMGAALEREFLGLDE